MAVGWVWQCMDVGDEACVDSRQSHLFNETLVICVKECSNISFGFQVLFLFFWGSCICVLSYKP
jgi:hypothetical protein